MKLILVMKRYLTGGRVATAKLFAPAAYVACARYCLTPHGGKMFRHSVLNGVQYMWTAPQSSTAVE